MLLFMHWHSLATDIKPLGWRLNNVHLFMSPTYLQVIFVKCHADHELALQRPKHTLPNTRKVNKRGIVTNCRALCGQLYKSILKNKIET